MFLFFLIFSADRPTTTPQTIDVTKLERLRGTILQRLTTIEANCTAFNGADFRKIFEILPDKIKELEAANQALYADTDSYQRSIDVTLSNASKVVGLTGHQSKEISYPAFLIAHDFGKYSGLQQLSLFEMYHSSEMDLLLDRCRDIKARVTALQILTVNPEGETGIRLLGTEMRDLEQCVSLKKSEIGSAMWSCFAEFEKMKLVYESANNFLQTQRMYIFWEVSVYEKFAQEAQEVVKAIQAARGSDVRCTEKRRLKNYLDNISKELVSLRTKRPQLEKKNKYFEEFKQIMERTTRTQSVARGPSILDYRDQSAVH